MRAYGAAGVRGAEGGFTLVDMLVALVLLGLLAATMAPFLQQWRRIDRQHTEFARQSEADALARYLQQAVAGAMPLPLVGQNLARREVMIGKLDSIRFVTVARRGLRRSGLLEAEIFIKEVDGRRRLIETFRQRRTADSPATEVTLMDDVTSISFRYLDRRGTHPQWLDNWTGQPSLPAAIRIEVSMPRGGKTYASHGISLPTLAQAK